MPSRGWTGPRARERSSEFTRDCVEDRAAVGEAHLRFLRVYVHVDEFERKVEVQDARRVAPRLEDRAIGIGDSPREEAVLHGTAVHEEMKSDRARARPLGRSEVCLEAHGTALPGALFEA